MGVDIVVTAQHKFTLDSLPGLCSRLSSVDEAFARHRPVLAKWIHSGWQHEWHWNFLPETAEHLRESGADMHGPYGFGLRFYERFYTINPSPRWAAFIDDQEVQESVCCVCEGIASCLGSDRLLYLPDSAYPPSQLAQDEWTAECRSMDELLVRLEQHCGPPAGSLGEIGRYLTDEEMAEIGGNEWPPSCRLREYDGYYVYHRT